MNVSQCSIKSRSALVAMAFLAALAPAFGQNPKLDIQNLEPLAAKAAEVVDVNLDGSLLKLAAKFMTDENDQEGLEVVKNLKGIYVKEFEFAKPGEYSQADVEAVRRQLQTPAWSRIVSSRNKINGETSEVYLMTANSGGSVLGMAILDAEPKELTVVNIVGPIDIDKLSALEGKMGIPHVDGKRKDSSPSQEAANEKEK
jgi:hypothetical protein